MEPYDQYKRPLRHRSVTPARRVEIVPDKAAFQGYAVRPLGAVQFPLLLEKEPVILDLGDHYTGYLHLELDCGCLEHIPDSPTNIAFTFGEMPIELMETVADSEESLSVGWLQQDFKTVAFMPYAGSLERRYSFRYVKLQRTDSVRFPVAVRGLYLDAVSAVDVDAVEPAAVTDPLLRRIDRMCVKTLAECEQDVFEDGPKRDRRLWIGDLRLQALVDYGTFHNLDLIRRCIYLFAGHRNREGLVAPCVFPDTPPYVDQWIYLDYSLCFGLCLEDYREHIGDETLPRELYDVARRQVEYAAERFDRAAGRIEAPFFIDHGTYDRSVAALGYFAYVLRRMRRLAAALEQPTEWLETLTEEADGALLRCREPKTGLFLTAGGELSWQSQVWAALSGALEREQAQMLLMETAKVDPPVRMSSPFMTHYYLEALCACGMEQQAMAVIREYWGAILAAGFDCCPECFDVTNDRVTPYSNPVLNSACHAWSCTPSYWIRQYGISGRNTGGDSQ